MISIRTLALAGASTAVLATIGMFAVPSLASGPPQIDQGNSQCYQTQNTETSRDGNDHFECDYLVDGGTGTVHATYYRNGSPWGTGNSLGTIAGGTFFEITGLCYYEEPFTILARFTDSTGAQDSVSYSLTCDDSYY